MLYIEVGTIQRSALILCGIFLVLEQIHGATTNHALNDQRQDAMTYTESPKGRAVMCTVEMVEKLLRRGLVQKDQSCGSLNGYLLLIHWCARKVILFVTFYVNCIQ